MNMISATLTHPVTQTAPALEPAPCGCPRRRAYGFTPVTHVDTCKYAPITTCPGCGHDIVRTELSDHDGCEGHVLAAIEEALLEEGLTYEEIEEVIKEG